MFLVRFRNENAIYRQVTNRARPRRSPGQWVSGREWTYESGPNRGADRASSPRTRSTSSIRQMNETADQYIVLKALESAVVQLLGFSVSSYTGAAERWFIAPG